MPDIKKIINDYKLFSLNTFIQKIKRCNTSVIQLLYICYTVVIHLLYSRIHDFWDSAANRYSNDGRLVAQ